MFVDNGIIHVTIQPEVRAERSASEPGKLEA